ncbi:MAG: RNA polymerase sigma-70 factor [Bacteroidales bacterium]|nr:RNA polymerase sigma-70 factor [Bacteroidales bacterium]
MEILQKPIVNSINLEDKHSFGVLFKNYYNTLCYYAYEFTNSREIAEDIVGDVFHKLWENRTNIKIDTSVKAYLFRSVHNHCINYNKHKLIIRKFETSFTSEHFEAFKETEKIQDSIDDYLIAQELQNKIDDAISILPAQCQQIFKLNRFENLKYKEIAERLNLSIKTIETQMSRAIKKMKEFLHDYIN